jgi:hypothetical protein
MSTNQMNIQLRPHQERGVAAMAEHDKGQIVVPTGGGKTLKMIYDALRELQSETPQTIVVVAPRILLAEQLSSEFLEFITDPMVRSSRSQWRNSSRVYYQPQDATMVGQCKFYNHRIIFTTYNSLNVFRRQVLMWTRYTSTKRIIASSVTSSLQLSTLLLMHVAAISSLQHPKHSLAVGKPGMNDAAVYGQVICKVPAPELVEGGYIMCLLKLSSSNLLW